MRVVSGESFGGVIGLQTFEGVPPRIGVFSGPGIGGIVDFVHELVFKLGVGVVGGVRAVLFEQRRHGPVAFPEGMHMLDGDCQRHGIVDHVGDIEIIVALGNLDELVGIIAEIVTVLDDDMIPGVNGEFQVVKTAVAGHDGHAGHLETEVIDIVAVIDGKVDVKGGAAHIGTFHILEKRFVEMELEVVCPYGERLQRQIERAKLTHIKSI